MMCIYCIECKSNNRKYIGSTTNLEKRIKFHFGKLKKGKHSEVLQHDYDKFGKENFHYYILEKVEDINKLQELEWKWINYYKTYIPIYGIEFGYNLSKPLSPQSAAALRANRMKNSGKNNGMYGKKHNEEMRKKISENVKKKIPRKISEEQKEEIKKLLLEETGETWGKKYYRIGLLYDVSDSTIKRIRMEMNK